jgi:hypothetical protein
LAIGNFQIIVVDSNANISNDNSIYWESKKYGNSKYKPIASYKQHSQLKDCKNKMDFIFLNVNSLGKLMDIINSLRNVLNNDTILLIDSNYANNIDSLLLDEFPNNLVLSIVSEVLVKVVKYDTRYIFTHIGTKVNTMIGTTILNTPEHIIKSLNGSNLSGRNLNNLTQALQLNGVNPCTIFQHGVKPTISSFIWKQSMSFISFDVLSLIYGELSLKNSVQESIIKKSFYDILKLAYINCEDEFPNIKEISKCDELFFYLLNQFNNLHSNYKIQFSNEVKQYTNDEILDIPLCIYNFYHQFNTSIPLCFEHILEKSKALKVECPYIECIYSFYLEIERVNEQKIFDWIKKISYQPERPLMLPEAKVINENITNSFESFSNLQLSGTETPSTPISNTPPPGFTYYPEYNIMAPKGINPTYLFNQALFQNKEEQQIHDYEFPGTTNKKKFNQHPRFRNVPKEEINGKKVSYHQIKSLVYPNTKGSTAPQSLKQAHKHIYQYANLKHTFESVNNRYGTADSLDIFKLSSGFKEKDEDGDEAENIGSEEKKEKAIAKG